jgi:cysteinyl-tRNA synthetase
MRATVTTLSRKPNGERRIVIAYLNIGQAESYRTYWKKGWRVGKPNWILGTDPDGWEGNFPVAYWRAEWKALIAGEGGLIDQIRDAGFDGLYLDWIGGFEDDNVIKRAKRDGVDPRIEIIRWVGEVSARAKAISPQLLVIAQNATALLTDAYYLSVIDAVAHEDIWFTGADSGPEGDCPVPRTTAEVGTKEFVASLNAACRRAFRRDAANAMHFVGEDAIVPNLELAKSSGKAIFTVDYAIETRNIATAAERSRALGFIPFVGARALKTLVPPIPTVERTP